MDLGTFLLSDRSLGSRRCTDGDRRTTERDRDVLLDFLAPAGEGERLLDDVGEALLLGLRSRDEWRDGDRLLLEEERRRGGVLSARLVDGTGGVEAET